MNAVTKLTAIAVLCMSIIFLCGWHFQAHFLLQCQACHWPIPYRSAFCFFLSSFGLYFLFSNLHLKFSKIMAGVIFLLGLQRLMENLLLGEKMNLLFSNFEPPSIIASHMTITAALGFMMVGAMFLFWPKKIAHPIQEIFLLVINVGVLFLGSLGIFTNLLPIRIDANYHQLIMHLYTAIGLVLIGMGILFVRFKRIKEITL